MLTQFIEAMDRPGRFSLVFGVMGAVYLLFDIVFLMSTADISFARALLSPPTSDAVARLIVFAFALIAAVFTESILKHQRATARALSVEQLRLRSLYENNPSAVTILDKDFTVLYANKRVAQVSGVPLEEIVHAPCHRAIMGAAEPCEGCLVAQVLDTARPHSRIKHEVTAAGKENWLSQIWYPLLDESGEVEAIVEIASDVSALRLDPLTSLPNRILLRDRIDVALAGARRHGDTLALLFLDVDGFKEINDSYGHRAGDIVLTGLAERLRGVVRQDETLGRLAGDEFLILLPQLDDEDEVAALAGRVLRHLEAPFVADGREITVSVSIGACILAGGAMTAEELIAAADEAMYTAKGAGRNRYHIARVEAS